MDVCLKVSVQDLRSDSDIEAFFLKYHFFFPFLAVPRGS